MTRLNDAVDVNRRTVLSAVGAVAAGGAAAGVVSGASDSADRRQLAALRRAASKYQNLERAEEDGYVVDDHCVAGPPGEGAMGFHAINGALIDETLSPSEPEILVYEKKGEEYVLVAVEFASMHPTDEPPPEIIGHELHLVPNLPFNWALHVWAWKHNPSGLFADWNPRVACPD